MTRDALSKALYCRTVATIVRRANSLKRLGSTSGTLSSDSNESVHNQTGNRFYSYFSNISLIHYQMPVIMYLLERSPYS